MKFNLKKPVNQLCRRIASDVTVIQYRGAAIRLHSFTIGGTPAGEVVKPHQHGYYEGIWVLEGKGKNLDKDGQILKPGICELHLPKERHGWMSLKKVWRLGIWLDVTPAVECRADAVRRIRYFTREPLEALLQEAQTHAGGRRERMAARMLLLLSPLLDLLEWPDTDANRAEAPEPDNRITRLVDRFFEDNMAEPLALRDVAQQMNMSMPTLTRQVRAETGKSVMRRLHEMRMKRAATLLTNSESIVKEIAAQVGIPEPSYFCRCFRRYFGRSPQKLRQTQAEIPGRLR